MLETILTRIILRFANRFICDTLHTDTFSLWGGDLVVHNFELQTREVARDALAAIGLRLVRGFVRELRVHVPWNAIRSQSLRVEVDAVEVVFATQLTNDEHDPQERPPDLPKRTASQGSQSSIATAAAPTAAPSQEGLDEANETWLQPLLRTIMGNITVVANNLVAKLPQSGAVACLTVARLDSRPTSSRWEAGFNAVKGPQPMLYRVVSVRDITVTLDNLVPVERRWMGSLMRRAVRTGKAGARAARPAVELPVFNRVSIEVLVEFPLLPWPGPVNPPPACRVDVHLSPIRAQLSHDQTQLLMRLLRPEIRQTSFSSGGFDDESDCVSDRASMSGPGRLHSWTSEPSTTATAALPERSPASAHAAALDLLPEGCSGTSPLTIGSQANFELEAGTDAEAMQELRPTGSTSEGTLPAATVPSDAGSSAAQNEASEMPEKSSKSTESGGLRGLLTDVLFGDDDDDFDDENESATMVQRETRRSLCFAVCVPLLGFSFEQFRDTESSRDANNAGLGGASPGGPFGLWEGSWLCTLSLIGLSALVVKPPRGDDSPLEGSLELHHVALHTPSSNDNGLMVAMAWGSPLLRSPLDADEALPTTLNSCARAQAWSTAARRLLSDGIEFPHPSHCIFIEAPPVPEGPAAGGQAALRVGLLQIVTCLCNDGTRSHEEETAEEESFLKPQVQINRASVQIAKVFVNVDASWLSAAKDALRPLASVASVSVPRHASHRRSAPALGSAVVNTPAKPILEAVVSCAGVHVKFDTFLFEVGQARIDWRQRPHGLDEALLATKLRETTVFVSSIFAHLVWQKLSPSSRTSTSQHGSLAFLRVSMVRLQQLSTIACAESSDVERIQEGAAQLLHVQEIVAIAAKPTDSGPRNCEPGIAHFEFALAHGSFTAGLCPIVSLLCSVDQIASVLTGSHALVTSTHGQDRTDDGRVLTLEIRGIHCVSRTETYKEEESAEFGSNVLKTALGWAGSSAARRGEDQFLGLSSDSEGDEVPVLERVPPAWRIDKNVLRTRQFCFYIRRLHISFSDGQAAGCVILAPYDLRPHAALLDTLSSSAPEGDLSGLPRDAMLSVICQLCPVAPPGTKYGEPPPFEAVMPPAEGVFGAELLHKRRQCCYAWMHAVHVQVDPRWVEFVFALADAVMPLRVSKPESKQERRPDMKKATDKEGLASVVLCSVSGAMLPLSLWLTLPSRPSACVTMPLVVASEPQLQASGLCVDIFDGEIVDGPVGMPLAANAELLHPIPCHTLQRMKRCFSLRQDSDVVSDKISMDDACLALSRVVGNALRSEVHTKGRPEVSLAANLNLAPLQWSVRPSHVGSLLSWGRSFQIGTRTPWARRTKSSTVTEMQEPPDPPERPPCGTEPKGLRVSVSVRATASVSGVFEIQKGSFCFQLPGVTGAFRHVTDASQPRTSVNLRLSRPHAVMNMPPIPSFDIVEWCEETVHGDDSVGPSLQSTTIGSVQRRSAYWLVVNLRKRGSLPVELSISTLPLGLCLSLVSLFQLASALAAEVSDVKAAGHADKTAPSGEEAVPTVSQVATSTQRLETQPANNGRRMSVQFGLNAVSVRLFPGSPFEAGAAHLAICVAEAAGRCTAEAAFSARAVISVSLFKQPDEELVTYDVVPAPLCLVDDFLRPCTVKFCQQPPEADNTIRSNRIEADVVHVDLLQRANFSTLLLLGNLYQQSLSSLVLRSKAQPSAQIARVTKTDVERKPEQFNLVIESVAVQLSGHEVCGKEPIYNLTLTRVNCMSTGYGTSRHSSFQCGKTLVQLADGRQSFSVANISVVMISSSAQASRDKSREVDVTVSIEGGISIKLCTGHLKSDLSSLLLTEQEKQSVVSKLVLTHEESIALQSARVGHANAEAEAEQDGSSVAPVCKDAQKSVKWRLLLNRIDAVLINDAIDACSFSINVLNLSIFSWPAASILPPIEGPALCGIRSLRVDVSIEALSALAHGPRVASAPLASPLSIHGSVVTLTPVDSSCSAQARTEVRFHSSPVLISAGAWQLRLLTNICSCRKPRETGKSRPKGPEPGGSCDKKHEEEMSVSGVEKSANLKRQIACQPDAEQSISYAELNSSSVQPSMNSSDQETSKDANTQHMISETPTGSISEQHDHNYVVMELLMDKGGGHPNLAIERGLQVEGNCQMPCVLQVPVLCSVSLEELEPWQAVKLPDDIGDGCPRCAIRLDRPAYVCLVACDWLASSNAVDIPEVSLPSGLPMPTGFTALLPSVDFDAEAWDDAQSCFVRVTNSASEPAICSNLIALRLHALAEKPYFRLLVYVATPTTQERACVASELLVHVSIPRLSWSILDSDTTCLAASCASVPPLEESFGTVSFHDATVSYWKAQGEGMVVRMMATKTSLELYDMSTLSLAEMLLSDENSIEIRLQIMQNVKPVLVPLRDAAHRCSADGVKKPVLDVSLGTWHIQLPPWTMARLASVARSVGKAWVPAAGTTGKHTSEHLSSRLPIVLQNGLPVPLIFGQVLTSEAIPLPSGHECGYAWKHADPTKQCLYLALDSKAPQSAPIPLGRLQVDTKVVWARLELWTTMAAASHAINLCIQRVSREQYKLIMLPAVLLISYIPSDVQFDVLQDGDSIPSNTNRILAAAEFLDEIPMQASPRAYVSDRPDLRKSSGDDESSLSRTSNQSLLSPGTFIGILPITTKSVWVRFRKPLQTWGPQLPLSTEFMEPYATMLPLLDEATGEKQNIMCKCADLWGTARDTSVWRVSHNEPLWLGDGDSGYSPTCVQFRAPEDAPLPNVLQLWPLVTIRNGCPFAIAVCMSSMGTADVPAGGCQVLEAAADPRRVTAMEFRALIERTGSDRETLPQSAAAHDGVERFSSGPWLVSALTQFSHSEADETVSWCNSIRCKSVFSAETELLLLVELRRCKLSGIIRSVLVEPMWTFHNETGEDVLVAAPCDQDARHVATPGQSSSTLLGNVQNDPSFPFVANFGFQPSLHSPTAVWSDTAYRCPMGQTTLIELHQGSSCFFALVSISTRYTSEGSALPKNMGGGVHVHLYAAAYVRNKVDFGMRISMGTDDTTEVRLPSSAGEEMPIPWVRWPSRDAAHIRDLRQAPTSDAVDDSSTIIMRLRLDDEACSSDAWSNDVPLSLIREKGVNHSGQVVRELTQLLATDNAKSRLCSGYVHDVQLDAATGQQASILVNIAFHVHAQGCFVLTLLRCLQPPLLCANLSEYAVWVVDPWREPPETPPLGRGHCVPPGAMMEIACPLLRSMEVFPPSGAAAPDTVPQKGSEHHDGSIVNHVHTIMSLDPDLHICDPMAITLTGDADISWPLQGIGDLSVIVRYASGVCRLELRSKTSTLPRPPPRGSSSLPLVTDVSVQVADLVVHLCARGSAAGQKPGRHLTFHASGVRTRLRMEKEASDPPLGRDAASRKLVDFHAELLSLADVCRPTPAAPLKQVLAAPALDLETRLFHPPYGLPTSYELVQAALPAAEAEQSICMVCLDDSFIQAVQFLAAEIATEFAVDSRGSSAPQPGSPSPGKRKPPANPTKEFKYIFLKEFAISQVPLYIDLQLSTSLFVSFTGLSITFPETRLVGVAANSFVLGQELLAHCIAFLLLNSPMLLGSCDLLGNPVQAYRHVRDGLSDLLRRPLREGFRSLARHLSSASLTSVSAVSESIRRNLPATPSSPPAVAPGEGGLGAGLRALAEGVGRGLSGILYWEQHTPDREGALGQLRGARNALTGAVAEPVGGLLDLVTSTARGWSAPEASVAPAGPHAADCPACLGCWPLRPELDVSPYKFHLQCCQGLPPPGSLPALLFWSPRCELVRVDGVGGTGSHAAGEPNLRLIRAGLLLTTTQLCVLVDEDTARVLDIGAVQAVEEARGRPFSLVTIASTAGIIWQLHVRGEPGEFVAHLRRARRLAGVPPGAV